MKIITNGQNHNLYATINEVKTLILTHVKTQDELDFCIDVCLEMHNMKPSHIELAVAS